MLNRARKSRPQYRLLRGSQVWRAKPFRGGLRTASGSNDSVPLLKSGLIVNKLGCLRESVLLGE